MIFGNGMGAIIWFVLELGGDSTVEADIPASLVPISFLLMHYTKMCILNVMFGVTFLIGGIYLKSCKLWANKMVTFLSIPVILIMIGLMIAMALMLNQIGGQLWLSTGAILNGLLWSAPFGILVWFLNSRDIKKHFS